MKSYTKAYLEAFGKDETDFIACEICEKQATEIHHILARSKFKHLLNDILNLQAICRSCHNAYGDEVYLTSMLLKIHKRVLQINKIQIDEKYFDFYIKLYEVKTELKK